MKVTIITVCFNSERFIGDALTSVDAQDHPLIEHIIVDGASRDGTVDVVRSHGRTWRRLVSEPDRGLYYAMNKGLALAEGELIGFLNADDVLADSSAISRLVRCALDTGCNALYSDLVYVSAEHPARIVRRWDSGEFSLRNLSYGWMPPHPTFYFHRSLLPTIGEFDTSMRIAADYDFMLRALVSPGVAVARVPGVMVRMRTGGASNRSALAMLQKSREDLLALRRNNIGGIFALACKNLRKLPQFLPAAMRELSPLQPP